MTLLALYAALAALLGWTWAKTRAAGRLDPPSLRFATRIRLDLAEAAAGAALGGLALVLAGGRPAAAPLLAACAVLAAGRALGAARYALRARRRRARAAPRRRFRRPVPPPPPPNDYGP